MTIDITRAQFATTIDTFKNELPNILTTISVPSQSYTGGETRTFSSTVDLSRVDATTQILHVFSFSPTRYYVTRDFLLVSSFFSTFCVFSIDGDTLTASCIVSNDDGSSHTVSSFTVDVTVKKFITPFD